MHVAKMSNGRWRVIVQANGQRRSATARTKSEASRRGAQLLLELGAAPRLVEAPNVAGLIAEHLATKEMRPTSRRDLELLANRLPAWIAEAEVAKVDTFTVERWYVHLSADGWTVHRIRKLHTLLRSAWAQAVRWRWAATNPVAQARQPEAPPTHLRPPTPDEIARAVRLADQRSPAFGALVRLAASSGARQGELCGLRWDDIDTDQAVVMIRRSVDYIDGTLVTSDTKTGRKGQRAVSITLPTVVALRTLRATQAAFALEHGIAADGWVFSHDLQRPWRPDYVSRLWRELRADGGFPDVRFHDLRHYVATELLGAGVDVRTVAGRLGHAQPATTLNIYAGFLPANDRAAAEILDQRLGG